MCSPHPGQRFHKTEVELQPTSILSGLIWPSRTHSTYFLECGVLSLSPNTRQSFACGILFSVCMVSGSLYFLYWSLQILLVKRQMVMASKIYVHAISLHLCNLFSVEPGVIWKEIHGRSGSDP